MADGGAVANVQLVEEVEQIVGIPEQRAMSLEIVRLRTVRAAAGQIEGDHVIA